MEKVKKILQSKSLTPRYADINDTARYTGFGKRTLEYLIANERIPFCRVGRLIRFDLNAIDEFMQGQSVPVSMEKARERR